MKNSDLNRCNSDLKKLGRLIVKHNFTYDSQLLKSFESIISSTNLNKYTKEDFQISDVLTSSNDYEDAKLFCITLCNLRLNEILKATIPIQNEIFKLFKSNLGNEFIIREDDIITNSNALPQVTKKFQRFIQSVDFQFHDEWTFTIGIKNTYNKNFQTTILTMNKQYNFNDDFSQIYKVKIIIRDDYLKEIQNKLTESKSSATKIL